MSAVINYDWPPTWNGKLIPPKVRVTTGSILLPSNMIPNKIENQSQMEILFHDQLWPPCKADGYQRIGRELCWTDGGRVLHYRILDTPDAH